jgi:pyruvate decarboxylase
MKVESAKLILSIGSLKSDFNSGNFSYNIPTQQTIEVFILLTSYYALTHHQLHSNHTQIQYALFAGIGMKELLPKLAERLVHHRDRASQIRVPRIINFIPTEDNDDITHAWFWPRVGDFFKPKDVIVTETGLFAFMMVRVPQLTLQAQRHLQLWHR